MKYCSQNYKSQHPQDRERTESTFQDQIQFYGPDLQHCAMHFRMDKLTLNSKHRHSEIIDLTHMNSFFTGGTTSGFLRLSTN